MNLGDTQVSTNTWGKGREPVWGKHRGPRGKVVFAVLSTPITLEHVFPILRCLGSPHPSDTLPLHIFFDERCDDG